MRQKELEKQAIRINIIINFIVAICGFWVFFQTKIQALFLDGFFSFISFFSTVFAITIANLSSKRTKNYPEGLYFLEPLYGIMKSIVTLILLCGSLIGTGFTAYNYFSTGVGSPIESGPIIPYAIIATTLCLGLFYYNKRINKKMNETSTILKAEAKSNFVDALQTVGIGISLVFFYFVNINGPLGFLHYTGDFFITSFLVLISLREPVTVFYLSIRELVQGTIQDKDMKKKIEKVVYFYLDPIIVEKKCNIYKIGKHIKIQIRIYSTIDKPMYVLLINAKTKIIHELNDHYESIELKYEF